MSPESVRTPRKALVLPFALAIAAAVLIVDLYTPQEMPPQYLYVLCVLLTAWSPRERTLWWMTAFCIGLTILGSILSPPEFDFYIILFNRSIGIVLLLATALLVWKYRRTHDALLLLNRELEARVEDRTRDLAHAFEEREELNRNLHDEVLQSLYAIGLNLESSGRSQQYGPIDPEGPRARALQQLTLVMKKIRGYIGGQPAPETLPFDQALSGLIRDMTTENGPRFTLEVDRGLTYCLPASQVEPLLLIVREALSNCVHHARARHGTVSARCHNGVLQIEVRDDGIGFDPAGDTKPGGHGLVNMAARAQQIGAVYQLHARPGEGVRVVIELPLEKEAAIGEHR
jgi:signal transduction histidine kinase